MARQCVICDKETASGNAVSHSNKKVRRQWLSNLQRVRIMVDGTPKRVRICTKCLKSGKIQRAV